MKYKIYKCLYGIKIVLALNQYTNAVLSKTAYNMELPQTKDYENKRKKIPSFSPIIVRMTNRDQHRMSCLVHYANILCT